VGFEDVPKVCRLFISDFSWRDSTQQSTSIPVAPAGCTSLDLDSDSCIPRHAPRFNGCCDDPPGGRGGPFFPELEKLTFPFEADYARQYHQANASIQWNFSSNARVTEFPVHEKQHRSFQLSFKDTVVLTLILAALLTAPLGLAWQQGQGSMPGMDMHSHDDMSSMGPSMAAMAGHMYMTPLRSKQPGDLEKAKAVVAEVKATIERYKDYRKALLDGYVIANPKLKQPQYHFISNANTREADLHFDPRKPTALLYRRTPKQEYQLEGVMFTASPTQPKRS
jgi:hypothetical protein